MGHYASEMGYGDDHSEFHARLDALRAKLSNLTLGDFPATLANALRLVTDQVQAHEHRWRVTQAMDELELPVKRALAVKKVRQRRRPRVGRH